MEYKTYGYLRDRLEKDLDLQGELFIQPTELIGYFNEGIDDCEAEIHGMYEDYFLKQATISLVTGQEYYDLPSDIYANKIRGVVFTNGDTVYKVHRVRPKDKFLLVELMNLEYAGSSSIYKYYIMNNSGTGLPQMRVVPTPQVNQADALVVHYIRGANKIDETATAAVADTAIIDIPEFYTYVLKYVKNECYKKEGHPNQSMAEIALERERRKMIDTLSNMVPDVDTKIEMDLDFYEEMS